MNKIYKKSMHQPIFFHCINAEVEEKKRKRRLVTDTQQIERKKEIVKGRR